MYKIELGDYILAKLSFQLRNGELTQPSPNHSNPEDYGRDRKWATQCKISFLRIQLTTAKEAFNNATRRLLQHMNDFDALCALEYRLEVEKVEREIKYQISLLRGERERKSYDIAAIKRIPMDTITEIMPNRFFKENPFRRESVPSDSLYWYSEENRCMDFGSGKSYDVIDLYMVLNKVDLKTALKEMSQMSC